MAAGDLITADWQMEWRGLLFGPNPYGITEVQGLADLPGLVTADRDRLRAHGQIAGDDFLTGRTVEVGFRIEGSSSADTFDQATALAAVTAPGEAESPLVFQIPGVAAGTKAYLNARVRARSLPIDRLYQVSVLGGRFQFYATDPRLYSLVQSTQTVSLPTAGGGLPVEVDVPATLLAVADSGSILVQNNGNFRAPWSFRINGPAVNPTVRNVTEGLYLGFNITLAAGEYLDVATGPTQRSVILNGSESRYYTLQAGSTWWDFRPGETEVAFRAATDTAATLTVYSRSAWSA